MSLNIKQVFLSFHIVTSSCSKSIKEKTQTYLKMFIIKLFEKKLKKAIDTWLKFSLKCLRQLFWFLR